MVALEAAAGNSFLREGGQQSRYDARFTHLSLRPRREAAQITANIQKLAAARITASSERDLSYRRQCEHTRICEHKREDIDAYMRCIAATNGGAACVKVRNCSNGCRMRPYPGKCFILGSRMCRRWSARFGDDLPHAQI